MSSLEGRVALVTGANRGLGLETSRQLLAKGLTVVMAGRDEAALERARATLSDASRALVVRLDVTDIDSIAAAHATVTARAGRVSILVNNAAVLVNEHDAPLAISVDAYRRSFDTNVFGVLEVCRAFVPDMVHEHFGRVVNVSSSLGQLSTMTDYAPAYSLSKTALNAVTRMLAHTYRAHGVLVNAVDPGWVRTDMGGPSAPRSPKEGADTITWLATLPAGGPTGGFFRDRRPIEW